MTGDEYKKLDIDERVKFLNLELRKGNSLSYIFTKLLGVSKSQSSIIKKNGYDLINNQYVKVVEATEVPKLKTVKKTGRPVSEVKKNSATLSLNKREYKILQVYAILHDTSVSAIINNFVAEFIKNKNLDLNIYKK
ncbi:hypothetical protein [Clostridium tyrobutyricum]|jgi:hypothetical protein|uniref:hypothetical protein n=1 Tax=Clostridium tyrobutyricum TaxID=1519 RepID=UPI0010AAE7C3|nr:hypothetical protein [Clostridium tyrobutyricum]MBV4429684.1 hypothetical protein [Clostridium tyrobutyricum]MBV4444933.1 hypothetical protein [Clostridium tyrobutyricum]QCH29500.1 hypothetical protein EZN00_03134 [Clostridium tyrobutyricum]